MNFTITGAFSQDVVNIYKEKGLEVNLSSFSWADKDNIVEQVKGYNCWLNFGTICTAEMLEALSPELKMVCRNGIGYDQIDIETATKLGICVTNTAGSMNESVGETAAVLILETMRKLYLYNRQMVTGNMQRNIPSHGLYGKTIGFVGFGGIARQCAQFLSGFGCTYLAYDEYLPNEIAEAAGAKLVSLDELAAECDVISIHCPLTPETHHMINMDFFKKMKNSAMIVNTARGPIINEKDLLKALQDGIIAGAGLDVYEEEPVQADNPLIQLPQVITLPHIAYYTEESQVKTQKQGADNVLDFIEGKVPRNCLNPEYVNYIK